MERSLAARFRVGQPIEVTLLGESERRITARVTNVFGRRLGLELQTPLEHGHAIRIESGDHAFLGEAVWCHGRVETHLVRVKFDQVLSGLAALGRMLEQFSDEPLGPEAVHSLHDRHQQDH